MIWACVLTIVASLLVPWKHVAVSCHHAPSPVWRSAVGLTVFSPLFPRTSREQPDRIYLRHCDGILDLSDREDIDTFAHELLHVKYPLRDHPWIYAHEHGFARLVIQQIAMEAK